MRILYFVIISGMMLALLGCAPVVQKIGANRYHIKAQAGFRIADDVFIEKATELCPKGFKVIERHNPVPSLVNGTIECE